MEISNLINFDKIATGDIINRTKDYYESFRNKLNNSIELSYPRLSILIEKLIQNSIENY